MKLYSGYIEILPDKVILLPQPMTWMEISRLRFGPLAIAGVALMGYGTIQQAQAQKAAGEAAAAEAKYNAQLAERQAQATEQRTAYEQQKQAEAAERQMSALQAGLGAAGAVSTAGTPLLIQAKQASEFELANLMIGYRGREEAGLARSQAAMLQQRAKYEKAAGRAAARTTLLTGFGEMGAMLGGAFYEPKSPTTV